MGTRHTETIWLVGMMGAGKSDVGRMLAERLGRRFVDTDREIEAKTGCAINEIFERDGETVFRDLERAVIESVAGSEAVVALGGGAIEDPGNRTAVAASGTVVYLRAGLEVLLRRLGDCESRPLLRGLSREDRIARLEDLMAKREDAYRTAGIAVDTEVLTPEGVVSEIVDLLAAEPSVGSSS